jgi:hypothetical protein
MISVIQSRLRLSFLAATVVVANILASETASANPHTDWKRIETPHFEVLFDSKHYLFAKEVAKYAESSWQALIPLLRAWPDKTVILIDDDGDSANGMAMGFPFPQIHLFPAPPAPGDSIADTGSWTYELVLHEYTHVLNFEPAHGFFRFARTIFGSIIRPNLVLPRWYLEGLAVELETRFSPFGGRLRSANFTAIPRAMVQDNQLRQQDIARIGDVSNPEWPGGSRPYLMGGMLWNHLANQNLSLIGELNDHYAMRVPFFIEAPLESRLGKNWQELLDDVYTGIETKAVQQLETICAGGQVSCNDGSKLGETSTYTRSPVISPDQSALAYVAREHNHDSVIWIASRSSPESRSNATKPPLFSPLNAVRVGDPESVNRVSWHPSSTHVLYDAIDSFGRYEHRTDLWSYDRERKKTTRLTNGWRAREPSVSPSGQLIAFVQLGAGSTDLAVAKLELAADGTLKTSNPKVLYQPPKGHRISWPEFLDDATLIFSERTNEASEELRSINFSTLPETKSQPETTNQSVVRLLPTGGDATYPRLISAADGAPMLLFASTRNGVNNLYSARVNGTVGGTAGWTTGGAASSVQLEDIRPLTNSTTRAWVGDLDKQTGHLIFSRLDGSGSRLRFLNAEERSSIPGKIDGQLPKVEPLISPPRTTFPIPESKLAESDLVAKDVSYWPYFIPRYWMPYAAFVPGGAFLSASTSAGDPMGRHSVAASISTDTRHTKPNIFASYLNSTSDVRFAVLADDFWQRLSSSGFDRRTTTADISGLFFIPRLSNSWRGEFGIHHQRSEIPTTTATDVRIRGGLRTGILWQSLSQKGLEISPESGGVFRLSHSRYIPEFGNQVYDKTDITASTYLSRVSHPGALGWLAERHVIALTTSASWLPALDRLLLGPSSISLPIESIALGAASSSFVMRGYPTGTFLARKYVRTSAEYRLPFSYTYKGFGTLPGFIRRWHAAFFADAVAVEGAFFDFKADAYRSSQIEDIYSAVGAEVRLDSTLFYHLPIQFIFGVHMGFNQRANPNGAYPVISIAL